MRRRCHVGIPGSCGWVFGANGEVRDVDAVKVVETSRAFDEVKDRVPDLQMCGYRQGRPGCGGEEEERCAERTMRCLERDADDLVQTANGRQHLFPLLVIRRAFEQEMAHRFAKRIVGITAMTET